MNKKRNKTIFVVILFLVLVVAFSPMKGKEENPGSTGNTVGDKVENNGENTPEADVPESSLELIEQVDAEYEKWLAATMVVAVSIEYPGFEDIQIYTESSTSLENKAESKGVYALVQENGKVIAVHSKPIPNERSEEGTKDISSQTLGFATFDPIEASKMNPDAMTKIELTELEELIKQSLLVSIYSR